MTHERELADIDVEEAAEELWTLGEQGLDTVEDLRRTSQVEALDAALGELERRGLARIEAGRAILTTDGRRLAERQVRRHRLAEVLFTTVLEVGDDLAVNRTACVMEHVLDAELTDSICAFLGHPPACPHGKAIPPGDCCRALVRQVAPLVQRLDHLPVGDAGRIVYLVPRDAKMVVRLANLGISPGAVVRLQQSAPAVVVRAGETTVALEPTIAAGIYVRPG